MRRSRLAKSVRLRLDERGTISISMPMRTPQFVAKQLLNDSRLSLRQTLQKIQQDRVRYQSGDMIGKSHRLQIAYGAHPKPRHTLRDQALVVSLPQDLPEDKAQAAIREGVATALRRQAKAYLPRRLEQLAQTTNLAYDKLRFSSAGTRWGSCSSEGTISLNIWLMEQPFELIDYVMIHELCHTRELNHSTAFWQLVESHCPNYRSLRRSLKNQRPYA